MNDKKTNKTFVDRLWDFLASVKLAVMIFAAIAGTSVVGTIIEQGADRETNLTLLTKFVGEDMAPQAYSVFHALGFMDMYRSWWFIGLLMLFAVNLIICSIDRIPPAWRAATKKMKPLKDEQFGSFPIKGQFMVDGSPADNRDRLTATLKSAGLSNPHFSESGDSIQAFSSKQGYSRLGVYITHLSILFIMIGAVVGVMFGFKGMIFLVEGEASAVAFKNYPLNDEQELVANVLRRHGGDLNKAGAEYQRSGESFYNRARDIGVDPLGFILKCDDSAVDFYPQSFSPKEYTSSLTVFDGAGKPVMKKRIEVNDPLRYNGYTFYQSSHGVQAKAKRQTSEGTVYYMPYDPVDMPVFRFMVTPPGGQPAEVQAKFGQPFNIPGSTATATVESFIPSYGGQPQQQGSMSNLVVVLEVNDPEMGLYTFNTAKRFDTQPMRDGAKIKVLDIWGIEYTGLQVRRDPGVWIVYLGCLIMAIGLYMAFFMSHRRLWIQATASGGKTSVKIAGTAHKHREAFERKVGKAMGLMSEGGNK